MLQEVVTTASRYDREIIETPRSVTVITSDDLKTGVFNSVGELLSNYSFSLLPFPFPFTLRAHPRPRCTCGSGAAGAR